MNDCYAKTIIINVYVTHIVYLLNNRTTELVFLPFSIQKKFDTHVQTTLSHIE